PPGGALAERQWRLLDCRAGDEIVAAARKKRMTGGPALQHYDARARGTSFAVSRWRHVRPDARGRELSRPVGRGTRRRAPPRRPARPGAPVQPGGARASGPRGGPRHARGSRPVAGRAARVAPAAPDRGRGDRDPRLRPGGPDPRWLRGRAGRRVLGWDLRRPLAGRPAPGVRGPGGKSLRRLRPRGQERPALAAP